MLSYSLQLIAQTLESTTAVRRNDINLTTCEVVYAFVLIEDKKLKKVNQRSDHQRMAKYIK